MAEIVVNTRPLFIVVLALVGSATIVPPAAAYSRPGCFIAPKPSQPIDSLISRMSMDLPLQRRGETRACEYYARGLLYHLKGVTAHAIDDYTHAIAWMNEFGDVYAARGDAYEDEGNGEKAARDYALAARFSTDSADELTTRCWVRALRGHPLALALQDCNNALKLQPGDFNALSSRGLAYLRMGNYPAAISDCDAALTLKPRNASALFIRALAKLKAGDAAGGAADLAAARGASDKVDETFALYGVRPER
jgi:tetratricopeptide (TPR) repeat protein